jgi:hypothetical protein
MDFYRASNSPSWERLWKALYVEDARAGHRNCPEDLTLSGLMWAGHKNCPKNVRLSKHTNLIIHWKALEELMVSLLFRFNHFGEQMHFRNFSTKNSVKIVETY